MRTAEHNLRLATIALAVVLGGCSSATAWLPGRNMPTTENPVVESTGVSHYLQSMHVLATANTEDQRRTFADLERRSKRTPTTTNRLALALARITPGHPGTNVAVGRAELERLLADPAVLVDTERELVVVMLSALDEQQRVAGTSVEQVNTRLANTSVERDRLARELEASRARAVQLQRALREAEEKLDAITRIERSIRERTDDESTR
ncbi:MAG: hypothetical protein AAGH76_05980 [Pseudomonadota bacterium]